MIVKMPLRFAVHETGNEKCGRFNYRRLQGRDRIRSNDRFVLVIAHLHELHFIMTTTAGFVHLHATKATLLFHCFKEAGRCQPLHTVMVIDDYSAGNYEIADGDYGKDEFFHEPV
jgi:hypothetical protein